MTGPDTPPTRHSARRYGLAALALVVVAVAAVVFAHGVDPTRLGVGKTDPHNLPVGPAAPGLAGDTGWINSAPLGGPELATKVVVYDFWTYSCINCVRTLPYLRAWYDRYAPDGLVVVGVHSPEFDFEKVRANVEAATSRLGVTWPVVLDSRHEIWDRFNNQYWPEKYVADRDGRVRYRHIGEGGYDETEDVLRTLLGVNPASPRAKAPGTPEPANDTAAAQNITAETYLGLRNGTTGATPGVASYPEPGRLVPGEARLVGSWAAGDESVSADAAGASIVLAYRAGEVNLVLTPAPSGDPVDVIVQIDGEPLPPEYRTQDTRVDESGPTTIRVDHAGLYRIALGPRVEEHQVRLTAGAAGVTAFAFTFGT